MVPSAVCGWNPEVHPCRCLCRGFLQTTRTTFLLFTILQLSQSRLTEGRTFIPVRPRGQKNATRGELLPGAFSFHQASLLPEGNAAFRQIVRRHLYHNFVAWQDPNERQSHFSGDMRQNAMSIGQLNPEHRIWKQFSYPAFNFDDVFSRHVKISGSPLVTRTVCSKWADGE